MHLRRPKLTIRFLLVLFLTLVLLGATADWFITSKLTISFNAESDKDISYQIFYTQNEGEKFSGERVARQLVPAGKSRVSIELPTKHLHRFRLDIGSYPGEVKISSLVARGKEKIQLHDFNKFTYKNIDKHQVSGNCLILNSTNIDPYIVYNEALMLDKPFSFDICFTIICALIWFLLSYKVVQYLSRFHAQGEHSRLDVVFLAVFFALMYIPMSRISSEEKSIKENRMLNTFPALVEEESLNLRFGAQFNDWFNDRFLGRDELLSVYNTIVTILAPMSGNE